MVKGYLDQRHSSTFMNSSFILSPLSLSVVLCVSVCVCVCLPVYVSLSVCLSVSLYVCLSVCLSVSLSLSLSFYLYVSISLSPLLLQFQVSVFMSLFFSYYNFNILQLGVCFSTIHECNLSGLSAWLGIKFLWLRLEVRHPIHSGELVSIK